MRNTVPSSVSSTISTLLNGVVEGELNQVSTTIHSLGSHLYQAQWNDIQGISCELKLEDVQHISSDTIRLRIKIDGIRETILLKRNSTNDFFIDYAGSHRAIVLTTGNSWKNKAIKPYQDSNILSSPMPANVLEILVSENSIVEDKQPLLRIEAMKMVITLYSPGKYLIQKIDVAVGENVSTDQVLMTFNPVR
ncbi:acetyl-CoA carboxylase biotin carboxyl carrier protein subunit [Photorhabdus heterorhabditis]|uniref:acetyl-CoA carboxylase biotin carboxyl carrier protein subunit n=1 Tax=Photorhabdus heterorhabditis TaxID=880156 RepID=UPI001562E5BA|nr:acetyl-CoA carboxylase biotin carboxyl carrier protein subunit [Photorhabdus heterorhabditis]NRN26831.1 acetyl-CoA carboxylase biotin carboxyl carrier protein subunit [Photorhabdus heterorhabditis subsp. aluminescens]